MTYIPSRIFNVAACALAGLGLYSSVALGAGAAGPALAVPTSDDIASYIMRVGGWLYPQKIAGDNNSYWTQVSYAVSDKAPATSTIGTTSILVLTVTRQIQMKSTPGNSAVACSQGEILTQTISFDPRDISVKDMTETLIPATRNVDPTKYAAVPLQTPQLWTVNFTVSRMFSNTKPSVVRQVTTVALPSSTPTAGATPGCSPPTGPWNTSTTLSDTPGFSIEFAEKDQADYLMALVKAAWVDTPWP